MATSNGLPPTLRVEELDSGNTYGFVLPTVSRMVLSGFFPNKPVADVAREFVSGKIDTDEVFTNERLEAWESFRSSLIAWMVRQVNGKTISLSAEDVDDPEQFPSDDRESLFMRAIRAYPSPKAQKVK